MEEKFREIFDKSPIGIIFFDREGNLTDANQSALERGGVPSLNEVKGINLFDNVNIGPNELLEKGNIKIQASIDFDNIKKKGIYNPTRFGSAFLDLTISIIDSGFLVQIQDITEQKNSENYLKIKEEQLRISLEAANAGMWIRDPIGKWKATAQLNMLFGRDIDDPPLLEEDFREYIHPEDLPHLERAWRSAINGEKPYNEEYRVVWPDGSIHWLKSIGRATLEDDVPRFIGITYDVTEHKKVEEAFHKSESQFQALIHNLHSGIALVDETGKFTLVNPAFLQMFGLDNELDILNVNNQDWGLWEVYGEDFKLLHVDEHPVRKVALTGQPVKNQLVGVRNPGATRLNWMFVSAELC